MKHLIHLIGIVIMSGSAFAATTAHDPTLMKQHGHAMPEMREAPLTEAGNDLFGTVQEVIRQLEAQPDTLWEKVDLEALRQHLLDMRDMSENVDILSQEGIEKGSRITLKATTPRAHQALMRVFAAHPAQLEMETGWKMQVSENNGVFTLITTAQSAADVAKIRGLGYIGLMARGGHHQPHHWAIATGQNPHAGH